MRRLVLLLAVLSPLGCAMELAQDDLCEGGACDQGIPEALCTVEVEGSGTVDVETRYLAGVLACENPAAPPASLRAQAIAARSFLYQTISVSGRIGDGEHAQVFTCNDPSTGQRKVPRQEHFDAVEATRGQILMYRNTVVAGFYSAGNQTWSADCSSGSNDATGTQRFITVNRGKSGSSVTQSRLGYVASGNHANRGAMGQWQANCLANTGMQTEDILHYFYGDDIQVVSATGACLGVSAQDIGDVCSDDSSCDDSCKRWYLDTVNQSYGMCSAACTGSCPAGSACVEMSEGAGSCAPVPSSANGFCASIPGTTPRVLDAVGGGSVASVCAPPSVGTSCQTSAGRKGECMDTSIAQCPSGVVESGVCPGGNDIQCCVY